MRELPKRTRMDMEESRLTLRRFTTDDLREFLEWAMDNEVTKYLMWDTYTSEEEARNYLATTVVPHPWLRAVCVDGRVAGSIVVERGTGHNACKGVLGYCLARRYWGRGVGTMAVRRMVAAAFAEMEGVVRVEALVDQRNGASRRVLEKAGFALEGTMRKYQVVKGALQDCFLFATFAPHTQNQPQYD